MCGPLSAPGLCALAFPAQVLEAFDLGLLYRQREKLWAIEGDASCCDTPRRCLLRRKVPQRAAGEVASEGLESTSKANLVTGRILLQEPERAGPSGCGNAISVDIAYQCKFGDARASP